MAIKKAFVIKDGLEVNSDVLIVSSQTKNVGIGSTIPRVELDLRGRFIATDSYLTGISTVINELNVGSNGTVLTALGSGSVGVGTALPNYLLDVRSSVSTGQTALYVQGDSNITGKLDIGGSISFSGFTALNANITGIATIGTVQISSGIVTATSTSGVVTYYGDGSKLTNVAASSAVYAINSGIATYATSSGISSTATYATSSGIATYATRAGISTYATNAGVSTYATSSGIATYATSSGISTTATYATSSGIATYATSSGIATYATRAGVSTYATSSGIATYATSSGISSTLTATASVNTTGIITASSFVGNGSGLTNLPTVFSGIATSVIGGIASVTQLNVSGVSTFTNGPVLVGVATATGTASQPLQVTGGAYVSGNLGVGVTNPQEKLHIYGGNVTSLEITADSEPNINFNTTDGLRNATLFNSYGSVGLVGYGPSSNYILYHNNSSGVLNNQYTYFQVAGQEVLRLVPGTALIGSGTSTGTASQKLQVTGGAYVSGNFGIGSTNPSQPLHVQGNARVTGGIYDSNNQIGTSGQVLQSIGTGISWTTFSGGATLSNDTTTNASYYPTFSSATSGTYTTAYVSDTKCTFNPSTGTLSATQFTSLSDATQKTNVRPIENPIEITKQLDGVRFDWINTNKPSLGLIAQEVEKVLPELVETNSDGIKSVSYSNMVGLLIEAIKEQQIRIEELERKLNV
jgi:hypothetical protein